MSHETKYQIIKYWPIIISAAAIIVAFTTLRVNQVNGENQVNQLQGKVSQDEQMANTNYTIITSQLSQIQTDISWIKTRLK